MLNLFFIILVKSDEQRNKTKRKNEKKVFFASYPKSQPLNKDIQIYIIIIDYNLYPSLEVTGAQEQGSGFQV